MASPIQSTQHFHRVVAHQRINAHQGEALLSSLSNQQPIKRVSMRHGQLINSPDVGPFEKKAGATRGIRNSSARCIGSSGTSWHQLPRSAGVLGSPFSLNTRRPVAGQWKIWFVLPQLTGLGRSAMAQRYGIADLEEAGTYLADPLLRQRLEAVIAVIDAQLHQPGQSLEHLVGSGLDAAKTVSSLTLFEAAGLKSTGHRGPVRRGA